MPPFFRLHQKPATPEPPAQADYRDQLQELVAQRSRELETSNALLRERIEEQRSSEIERRRLIAILNSTSDLVAMAYPDGQVMFLNEAGRYLLGLEPQQNLDGFRIEDAHPPWAWQIVEQDGLPTAIREGVWRGQSAIWDRAGLEVPVSQVIMAHRNATGQLEYLSTIMRDITERRQAEEALRTWMRRYDFLVEASGQVVYEYIIGSQDIVWGHSIEKVLGYRLEEMTGGIAQWIELIHPEDRQATLTLLDQAEQTCSFWDTSYRLRHRDGRHIWVRDRGYFLPGPDGRAERQLGLVEDISGIRQAEEARIESERRLQEAQELAHLGNWIWDVASGQVDWSPEVYRIFRLDPATFKPNINSIMELSPWPQEHERDQELIRRAVDSHESGSYEQRFLRPDGSTGYYLSSYQGCYDANGRLTSIVGTIQDITERKLAEQERERLQEQLAQAQKMETIGRLAGGVAHDFNNILTAIAGNAELALLCGDLDPKTTRRLKDIEQAAASAACLTRQLLAFSRKQIIKPEALDLNDLIRTMGRMLERVIGEDISLRTVAQPGLNFIMADPGQLQQIVMNLAVNARDAMPQGGTLTIETANAMLSGDVCRQTDLDPGEYVVLTVSDTGCGMDAEIKQHLFEPFFTTKEVGKGTGLGLATVYGAVKQNRGAILVDSEPGQGTCFKIYLPATPALPAATEAISCPLLPGGSETILLAEDDPLMREFISDALTHLGYRVLAAASGPEALRLAHACDDGIDLLLTDVVMPGMNGRQLAERLQAERPGLKVLFASGYTQDAIVHQGVLEQHLNFIGKPFSAQSLACKLREVLERP